MFSSHIPPAWLAMSRLKDFAGKIYHANSITSSDERKDSIDNVFNLNMHGYREEEYAREYFKFDRVVLAIGHSCVFGVSVKNEFCWPRAFGMDIGSRNGQRFLQTGNKYMI